MDMRTEELARRIGAELRGDPGRVVTGCAGLQEAGASDVSFLANARYTPFLATTKAGAVILADRDARHAGDLTVLVAAEPYFAFRQAMVCFYGLAGKLPARISDQSVIDPSAAIGSDCRIEPFAYIGAKARIGRRCVIHPHCYIGSGCVVGDDCTLFPNVTIYQDCVLGDRVTLHAGCVIGQDGFGYAMHAGAHQKIPQAGNVVIADDVEMGANCAIDRATMGSTRIDAGTKLSNLVAIGHGTKVGKHNILVAQVGIAGSVQTGDYVVLGGQTGVAGHLRIGHQVQCAGKTAVIQDIPDGHRQYGGIPAVPLPVAKRNAMFTAQMPQFIQHVRRMDKRLAELERRLAEQDAARPNPSS